MGSQLGHAQAEAFVITEEDAAAAALAVARL